jgi:hypothetical protein
MSDAPIKMVYDPATRRAVFTFKNGRELIVGNLTEVQARRFLERAARPAPECERRECRMHTVDAPGT